MGRTGIGVGFRDADSSAPATPYALMMDGLAALVDDASVAEVKVAMAHAERARTIEAARVWAVEAAMDLPGNDPRRTREELAERSFAAQMAATLHMSEASARNLIGASRTLVNDLPLTMDYLSDGAISWRHVQILVDQVPNIGPELAAVLEQQVLCHGAQQTPPQFERAVRTAAEKLHVDDAVERAIAAAETRTTYVEPMKDGMGRYVLEVPIVQVVAIDNFVTDVAKSMQVEGELRTLTQLKADVASDLLLNVDGAKNSDGSSATSAGKGDSPQARYRSIRPKVLVTVPVLTLLKRGKNAGRPGEPEGPQEPGTLEGYGPIDLQTARNLAGNAKTFIRILTHPETGIVLSVGRRRYRIPALMRLFIRFRDGTCRFPGCKRNAMHCELDHGEEFQDGGETAHINLEHLCTGHHALKGNTAWQPFQDPQGTGEIMWTSPTGHIYTTHPENPFGGQS